MAKAKARKAGARKRSGAKAKGTRKTARKGASKPARKAARRKDARTAAKTTRSRRATRPRPPVSPRRKVRAATSKTGGAKRPAQGRKVRAAASPVAGGKTSKAPGTRPWPTRASTGAGVSRSPYLERERRKLREEEEDVPTPPSSLDLDRRASAVRTGRQELREALHEHTETSPALTGGDVDADWQGAASLGDEAAGGDNPTPDQQRVDDIGKALGVEYQDNEELRGVEKIDDRDKKRWELDPASAEDYKERQK